MTVEAVDVSRDGLQRRQDVSESEDKESIAQNLPEGALKGPSYERKLNRNKERTQPNLKSEPRPKKKKKKFRYESKADRKATRYKERMGSKAKAKARRE